MHIWPAIDLRGGRCVRLLQGDYNREKAYYDDPADAARQWIDQGAQRLHVVDLDGARDGKAGNHQAIAAIVAAAQVPCQIGGGVRDDQAIQRLLDVGAARLVVGTQALKEPDWFEAAARRHPGRLVLGLDARNGQVAAEGWLETSDVAATELAARYAKLPLAGVVYTDIAKDGMLEGPNVEAMRAMAQVCPLPVIASGGVTTADDVRLLAQTGVEGCIVGRALYEGRLSLADAQAAAGASPS